MLFSWCQESKAQLLQIPSTLEWLDFQGRLNVQISDMLHSKVAVVDYSKFNATYTIPCHVPNALPLLASSNYNYLLKNVVKVKDPSAKIVVIETGPQQQVESNIFIISIVWCVWCACLLGTWCRQRKWEWYGTSKKKDGEDKSTCTFKPLQVLTNIFSHQRSLIFCLLMLSWRTGLRCCESTGCVICPPVTLIIALFPLTGCIFHWAMSTLKSGQQPGWVSCHGVQNLLM